ncbi:MAG: DUF2635 domain-containing protein [Parvibaculum sedimenti]|uniref:DUF2635 domain-containing protein n=1 Tax=Parvibaculum sedimenti TaxID=2608632 RepID=UPI003BB7222D
MAEKKWFIPAEGATVRDPFTRAIAPAEGWEVEDSLYWRRKVAAGDGVFGTKPEDKTRTVKKESANV